MFTGIVEEVGEVVAADDGVLYVRGRRVLDETKPGDSIAVDGVDLTVHSMAGGGLVFGVMPETYRLTTLGLLQAGRRVNLERPVRPSDRLSGHICVVWSRALDVSIRCAPTATRRSSRIRRRARSWLRSSSADRYASMGSA